MKQSTQLFAKNPPSGFLFLSNIKKIFEIAQGVTHSSTSIQFRKFFATFLKGLLPQI